ncbi:hypothetical protein JCM10450v2_002875 [Rhodotorula kratochvilovae]
MSTPKPSICAVCGEETTKQCSKCRANFFCSTRCQALLWPTHKVLCGRDPNVFYLPPLTPDELKKLDEIKDKRPYRDSPKSLFHWVTELCDVPERAGAFSSPMLEDMRLGHLLSAYDCLCQDNLAALESGDQDFTVSTWQHFANSAWYLRDEYFRARFDGPGRSTREGVLDTAAGHGCFTVLNAFFRQQLVHATLGWQCMRPKPRLSPEELFALASKAQLRAIKILDETDVPDACKKHLKVPCLRGLFNGMAARAALFEAEMKEGQEGAQ